jgi:peptidoglycan/xylan/chitin deacetylase (PgdA/CDA1 family)
LMSPSDHNLVPKGRLLAKRILFASVPRSRLVRSGDAKRPEFALTFDDGPDPASTPAVLATLRRHEVRATFFLIGNRAEQYPELLRRIMEDGHEVGSHSYSHPYFNRLSAFEAIREIAVSQSVLENLTGQACPLFRPPFGKLSLRTLLPAWLHKQCVIMWTVDLKDYRAKDPAEIESRVRDHRFVNGDIILYHGLTQASLAALSSVIEAAAAGGRKGVPVSYLMRPAGSAPR